MQRELPPDNNGFTRPIRIRPIAQGMTVAAPPVRTRTIPPTLGLPPAYLPQRPIAMKPRRKSTNPLVLIAAGVLILAAMTCAAGTLGVGLIYAGGVLPGVQSGGVALGGKSEAGAAVALQSGLQLIVVRDGQRAWKFDPATLGITFDTSATANAAYTVGRSNLFDALPGIFSHVDVPPVVSVDLNTLENGLRTATAQFEQAPVNAGVQVVDGQIQTTAPVVGRLLDLNATVAHVQQNAGGVLADGMLELVMQTVQPTVTDATPILQQAKTLLANPLDIRVFDPVTGDSVYWSVPPDQWSKWLTAAPAGNGSQGFMLAANDAPIRDYLTQQVNSVFDSTRYLNMDEAVASVQNSIAQEQTTPYVRVYHHDAPYVVQQGDTITSIAWDKGVPYLYIEKDNNGITDVTQGQTIMIPSADEFMPYPVDPNKRIVVSISQQKVWIYENGGLKWQWTISTGIDSSPTWPGIYQIISHDPNAYAANWNLWMPNFMGVYQPIPGADFTNGFHGFPTRGSSQLLWTNDLGTRVTYGCILLSNENAQTLYNWAEEGVVVEIQA